MTTSVPAHSENSENFISENLKFKFKKICFQKICSDTVSFREGAPQGSVSGPYNPVWCQMLLFNFHDTVVFSCVDLKLKKLVSLTELKSKMNDLEADFIGYPCFYSAWLYN